MRALALVLLLLLAEGCGVWSRDFFGGDAARALANADAHAAHGDYPAAMAAYDSYLARYPDDGGVDRARAIRMLVKDLLDARAERDRLTARGAELARQEKQNAAQAAARDAELARQMAARDAELAKLRQEIAARQAEVARLKEDLEALKRTDLQMERRRR